MSAKVYKLLADIFLNNEVYNLFNFSKFYLKSYHDLLITEFKNSSPPFHLLKFDK